MALEIEILVTEHCPHGPPAVRRTEEVMAGLIPGLSPVVRTVLDREEALGLEFPGSPTIRVNGRDIEGPSMGPPALACRRYGAEGVPPAWMIEAGILRGLSPRHVLFLCVANSARSQMAEGIARSLAPEGLRISSAGSEPTQIRPEAIRVLEEIGVDPKGQHSKAIEDVGDGVDAVITLCAEEVCPTWLGQAWRIHWGLPDPAGIQGSEEERLQAFRDVRDELRKRLGALFEPGSSPRAF